MTFDADVARLSEIRPEYLELSQRIREALPGRPETDDELSQMLGWKVETVSRVRRPRVTDKGSPDYVPTKRETALSLLSVHWQTAESVIPFLAVQLDWQQSSVKSLLRQLESEGLVQSQGKPVTFRGKKGKKRTHYRRTPSATDVSLSI